MQDPRVTVRLIHRLPLGAASTLARSLLHRQWPNEYAHVVALHPDRGGKTQGPLRESGSVVGEQMPTCRDLRQ